MNYKIIVSPIASKNIEDAVEYYIYKDSKQVTFDFLKDYKKTIKRL
jgi:toxin ParE1/3/4